MKDRHYLYLAILFFALAFLSAIVLVRSGHATPYYPVSGGSVYLDPSPPCSTFDEWVFPSFYGTTWETSPGIYDYLSNGGHMLALSGFAQTLEGFMPRFTDYILGTDYTFSFEAHPVSERPVTLTATPIPAPVVLLASGLVGLAGFRRGWR